MRTSLQRELDALFGDAAPAPQPPQQQREADDATDDFADFALSTPSIKHAAG
eukprot:gene1742-20902_t